LQATPSSTLLAFTRGSQEPKVMSWLATSHFVLGFFLFVGHLWHAGRARAAAAGFENRIDRDSEPVLALETWAFITEWQMSKPSDEGIFMISQCNERTHKRRACLIQIKGLALLRMTNIVRTQAIISLWTSPLTLMSIISLRYFHVIYLSCLIMVELVRYSLASNPAPPQACQEVFTTRMSISPAQIYLPEFGATSS